MTTEASVHIQAKDAEAAEALAERIEKALAEYTADTYLVSRSSAMPLIGAAAGWWRCVLNLVFD